LFLNPVTRQLIADFLRRDPAQPPDHCADDALGGLSGNAKCWSPSHPGCPTPRSRACWRSATPPPRPTSATCWPSWSAGPSAAGHARRRVRSRCRSGRV